MSATDEQAPFLSVTVLNYNYAHYLPKCLDSILGQTMTDFELILINDCSTDNSLEVIRPYLHDPRIRLVNHASNQGFVASLIEGCQLSRGRYITVISADDYALDSSAFDAAYQVLSADQQISLLYSAWQEVDDLGRVRHARHAADANYVVDGAEAFRSLLTSMPILHSGTIIKRDAYFAVGGYNANCRYAVDVSMWLSLCSTGRVAYINRPWYAYRAHDTNMSNSKGALWRATAEWLDGIDAALDRFSDNTLPDKTVLKRHAQQHALLAVCTHDIFAGRIYRGWYGFWQACRRYPMLTLFQLHMIPLLLRTMLGSRLYEQVVQLRRGTRAA